MEKTGIFQADTDSVRVVAMRTLGVQVVCRRCGAEFNDRGKIIFLAGGNARCSKCYWVGNWRFGTILQNSNLTDAKFLALFHKFSLPDDLTGIAKRVGVKYSTAKSWQERLKAFLPEGNE